MGKEWTFFLAPGQNRRRKWPARGFARNNCGGMAAARQRLEGKPWNRLKVSRGDEEGGDAESPFSHPADGRILLSPHDESAGNPRGAADADHIRDAGEPFGAASQILFYCKHLRRAFANPAEGGDNVSRLMYSRVFVVRGPT
jgi:hypothetical protein